MSRTYIAAFFSGLLVFLGVSLFARDNPTPVNPPAATDKPMAIFQRLLGSWRGEHRATGESFGARVVYELGIADQVLKGQSFVPGANGDATLRYETFIYYHPRDKTLHSISIGKTGGVFDGTISGTPDELNFEFSAYLRDQKTDYKQTIKFVSDDRYQWTVWQNSSEGWKQVIEGQFVREAPKAASAK
jgi:hypothetical protein